MTATQIVADLTRRHDAPLSAADALAEMARVKAAADALASLPSSSASTTVLRSLPILAVAFGKKHGVKVGFGGYTASTDGRRITLPPLPLDAGHVLPILAFGYLYHETGHIEVTQFETMKEAKDAGGKILGGLLNIIEDIRMEAWRNARYPGSAKSLVELIGYLQATGAFGTPECVTQAHPAEAACNYLITHLRATQLHQPTQAIAALWREKLVSLVGEGLVSKIDAATQGASGLASTADALVMAKAVLALLKEEEQDGKGDESDDGESSESTGNGGAGDDSDEGDESNTGSGKGDESDDGESSESTGNGGAGDDSDEGDESDTATGKGARAQARKEILEATENQMGKTDLGDVVAEILDAEAEKAEESGGGAGPRVYMDPPTRGRATIDSELAKVESESRKLRTVLASKMQAVARVKRRQVEQGSRIHGRSLHRLVTDDPRLFIKKGRRIRPNTAVQIILDNSGSMKGSRIEVARTAALAVAVGLEQIRGVKTSVLTIDPMLILKEWDEAARAQASRFVVHAHGGTPLAQAMVQGAAHLAVRRESRKLMLVVTDGYPDSTQGVVELVGRLERANVECVGVGIQTDAPSKLFRSAVAIQSLEELSSTLFGVIGSRLI